MLDVLGSSRHERRTEEGTMSAPHIGYAAMLEQFGPQEVVGYSELAGAVIERAPGSIPATPRVQVEAEN